MAKYCGLLTVGASHGGGTVGSQTIRNDRVVSSFEVPVAIEYELKVGDTHFKKIRCCEQAVAPFVAENHGNEVCIYTFRQIPKTDVLLGIVSNNGPSYRMSSGRLWLTLFAQAIFLPLLFCLPLLFIPFLGWALIPVILYFTTRYSVGLYKTWQEMAHDGAPGAMAAQA